MGKGLRVSHETLRPWITVAGKAQAPFMRVEPDKRPGSPLCVVRCASWNRNARSEAMPAEWWNSVGLWRSAWPEAGRGCCVDASRLRRAVEPRLPPCLHSGLWSTVGSTQ